MTLFVDSSIEVPMLLYLLSLMEKEKNLTNKVSHNA